MDRPITPKAPLTIGRELLTRLMSLDDDYAAAQAAFRAHAEGRTRMPLPLHIEADAGGFHAKGAFVALDRKWVAVKVNSNFPGNPAKGLPTIQGAVLLYDGDDGRLLAILDSMEVTARRTAAASALAAEHLAQQEAASIAILGCGVQGRAQLAAIARVRPPRQVYAWDVQEAKAQAYAEDMRRALTVEVMVMPTAAHASRAADIVVTATTAREPFLGAEDVRPGTFIAAVGADNPHKSELHPELIARSTVIADSLDQACIMGDLHHAIAAGVTTRESGHAELAEVVAGRRPGRANAEQVTVFDSTGLAIQDVTAAAWAYERALAAESLFVTPEERGNF